MGFFGDSQGVLPLRNSLLILQGVCPRFCLEGSADIGAQTHTEVAWDPDISLGHPHMFTLFPLALQALESQGADEGVTPAIYPFRLRIRQLLAWLWLKRTLLP